MRGCVVVVVRGVGGLEASRHAEATLVAQHSVIYIALVVETPDLVVQMQELCCSQEVSLPALKWKAAGAPPPRQPRHPRRRSLVPTPPLPHARLPWSLSVAQVFLRDLAALNILMRDPGECQATTAMTRVLGAPPPPLPGVVSNNCSDPACTHPTLPSRVRVLHTVDGDTLNDLPPPAEYDTRGIWL